MTCRGGLFKALFLLLTSTVLASNSPQHVRLSLSSSADEMLVVWQTTDPAASSVQYGLSVDGSNEPPSPQTVTGESSSLSFGTGFLHRATMTNLLPGKEYAYRVGDSSAGLSPYFRFRTRSASPDQEYTMVAYGDMGTTPSQPGSDDFAEALRRPEVLDEADIVVHAGDLCYAFQNLTKVDRWFSQMDPVMSRLPYMIVPGNRDDEELIEQYFAMPGAASGSTRPNFYWSTDYNSVHLVGISTSQKAVPLEIDSDQYRWLESDLRSAAAKVADPNSPIEWIVLLGHTPLYSSSNGHEGGNKKLKAVIEHLLAKYGVTLALWGDDHGYERTFPMFNDEWDATSALVGTEQVIQNPTRPVHFVVGTAGVSLDGWKEEQRPPWSAARALAWGHLSLTFSSSSIKGRFVGLDGQVFDSFKVVRTDSRRFLPYFALLAVLLLIVAFGARYQSTGLRILRSSGGLKFGKSESDSSSDIETGKSASLGGALSSSYENSSPAMRLKLSSNSLQRR